GSGGPPAGAGRRGAPRVGGGRGPPFPPALAASGITSTSAATNAVTRPRPPFPHSAFERESSLLPVPQSALDRLWPRVPAFLSIANLPLPRLRRCRNSSTGERLGGRPDPPAERILGASPRA